MHCDCPSGTRHVGGAKLNLALVRNVRTWPAMAREKAQAAPTARPKVPMRRRGADCPVVVTLCQRSDEIARRMTPTATTCGGHLRKRRPLKIQRKNSGSGNKCLRAIGTTTRSLRNWAINRSLDGKKWMMGGTYTVCDPYAFFIYDLGSRIKLPMHELPVYAAFNKRMLERPAVCKVRGLEENILKGKDSWHGQYYAQPRSV